MPDSHLHIAADATLNSKIWLRPLDYRSSREGTHASVTLWSTGATCMPRSRKAFFIFLTASY